MTGNLTLRSLCMLMLSAASMMQPLAGAEPATAEEAGPDMCTQEALMSYFPESYVKNSLKKFNVPEDKWPAITQALHSKERDVIKTVEAKAENMNPNPLKDPQQRQAAVKIFKETLLEIATVPLKNNGVTDETQIKAILDDIQQQKAKEFAYCIEKHRFPPLDGEPAKAKAPAEASTQQ